MAEILSLKTNSFVNDFCFEDSGKLLFAGCQNSKIQIWNLSKKRMVSAFGSHSEPVRHVIKDQLYSIFDR
jgi:WD40 repeat protein